MTAKTLRERYELVVFGVTAGLALASAAWWGMRRPAILALRREPASVALAGAGYAALELPAPGAGPAEWPDPPAQSHGADWIYEVFTPPAIYYHEPTKSFVVTPPSAAVKENRPVELELLEVKRQPYRLQLVGYLGSPGDYVAIFSSPVRAETLLARAGQRIDSLGISVKAIEVGKVAFYDPEGRPAIDLVARAVLTDELAGEEVVLDSQSRRYTGKLVAVLRGMGKGAGSSCEASEGSEWLQGTATCRVARIQLVPPLILIERVRDGGEADTLSLAPAGQAVPPGSPSREVTGGLAKEPIERMVATEKNR